MPQQDKKIGDDFHLQFIWQLPNQDYVRAVFQVKITGLDTATERYIIQLTTLLAKRQESNEGVGRPAAAMSTEYWPQIESLVGCHAAIAYEATDQRPVRLRLQTLTREHNYFTRYSGPTNEPPFR